MWNLFYILKIIKIVYIVQCIQNFHYAYIFLTKSKRNLYLACFLISLTVKTIEGVFVEFVPNLIDHNYFIFTHFFNYLSFPLLYLYIVKIKKGTVNKWSHLVLIPSILEFTYLLGLYFANGLDIQTLTTSLLFKGYISFVFYFNLLFSTLIIFLLFQIGIKRKDASLYQLQKVFVTFLVLFITIKILSLVLPYYHCKMLLSLLTLFLTTNLIWYELSTGPKKTSAVTKTVGLKKECTDAQQHEAHELIQCIETFLETSKIYKNMSLTIYDISKEMKLSQKKISKAINSVYGINFNTYVNEYRVKESKKLLLSAQFKTYTIEAISKEVGFKSKSAFYRAFKTIEQTTPLAYKKLHSDDKNTTKVVNAIG